MAIGSAKVGTVAEAGAAATSITGNLPGTLADGDFVIAVFANTSAPGNFTAPSGWSQLFAPTTIATGETLAAYYKIFPTAASATAPSASWTTAGKSSCECIAYSGVDPNNPIDVAISSNHATATTVVVTGITSVTSGVRLFTSMGGDSVTTATITVPSGYSSLANTTGTGRRLVSAELSTTAAGASGNITWTSNVSIDMTSFLAAIRPAAISGTPNTLSITSTLTVAGSVTDVASGTLASVSSLTVQGSVPAVITGTVTLTSAASITVPNTVTVLISAGNLLTTTSTLTSSAVSVTSSSATLTTASAMTATSFATRYAAPALTSASVLTVGGIALSSSVATLSTASLVSATSFANRFGVATLATAAGITVVGKASTTGAGTLTSASGMTSAGLASTSATALLWSYARILPTPVLTIPAAATLSSAAVMPTTGVRSTFGTATLSTSATITINTIERGRATLNTVASITPTASPVVAFAGSSLVSAVNMAAAGAVGRLGLAALSSASALSATAIAGPIRPLIVTASNLTVSGVVLRANSVPNGWGWRI